MSAAATAAEIGSAGGSRGTVTFGGGEAAVKLSVGVQRMPKARLNSAPRHGNFPGAVVVLSRQQQQKQKRQLYLYLISSIYTVSKLWTYAATRPLVPLSPQTTPALQLGWTGALLHLFLLPLFFLFFAVWGQPGHVTRRDRLPRRGWQHVAEGERAGRPQEARLMVCGSRMVIRVEASTITRAVIDRQSASMIRIRRPAQRVVRRFVDSENRLRCMSVLHS